MPEGTPSIRDNIGDPHMQGQLICSHERCDRFIVPETSHCEFHQPVFYEAPDRQDRRRFMEAFKTFMEAARREAKGFVQPLNGFKFAEWFKLPKELFEYGAEFDGAEFHGNVNLSGFEIGYISFKNVQFKAGIKCWHTIFKRFADFNGAGFGPHADFHLAEFELGVSFIGSTFPHSVTLREAKISGHGLNCNDATFGGDGVGNYESHFSKMEINADWISFDGATIQDQKFYFDNTTFRARRISFDGTTVGKNGSVSFEECTFDGPSFFQNANWGDERVIFRGARFMANALWQQCRLYNLDISKAQFSGDATLNECTFAKESNFNGVRFLNGDVGFTFSSPTFADVGYWPHPQNPVAPILTFIGVAFNEDRTVFQNVGGRIIEGQPLEWNERTVARLNLQDCRLRGVHFINCQMLHFSFTNSAVESARFTACEWHTRIERVFRRLAWPVFERRNVLRDELSLPSPRINDTALRQVAETYQNLKVAYDAAHRYSDSGWFYFNRLELEREIMRLRVHQRSNWRSAFSVNLPFGLALATKRCTYYAYRLTAGYGEKPNWSFWSLCVAIAFFTAIHLLVGFRPASAVHQWIQYGSGPFNYSASTLFSDVLASMWYTVSTIFALGSGVFQPDSLILKLFLGFFLIGMQRLFKRF